MDKRILIPTDFSRNALNAIRYAIELYKTINCEFYFLNVFHTDGYKTDGIFTIEPGSPEYETAKGKSEEGLIRILLLLNLHHENPKHKFYTISSNNFLSEAIKQNISSKDIDVIIMGTQGATGAKGIIFGSNTVNAMEKITECPVLAIPQTVRFSIPNEIVFPTNYKTDFKRKELHLLIEIANVHHASIRVLFVHNKRDLTEQQEKNKQLLNEILEPVSHSFHTLSDKNISSAITSFVDSRHSSMIAFINKKHFFFGSIFSKPLVKEIGYDDTVPVLALH